MRLSRLLAPLRKVPQNASVTDLLLAHGFIHQEASGVFDLLPLGLRVQQKIEAIVRKNLNRAGCVELALSTLVDPSLWRKSGRLPLDGSGTEELLFTADSKHLLAPTGEEQVTSLVGPRSYRSLPLRPYQITRKYRNELRPRGGLLRTREFAMSDLYTFDSTKSSALQSYEEIAEAYRRIFDELAVPYVRAVADSGTMGGSLSHEYHYLCDAGEDEIAQCKSCGYAANIEVIKEQSACSECGSELDRAPGIEVGHTFFLGTRYTAPFGATIAMADGTTAPMEMGCYGIGTTRLVAATCSALQDAHGMRWPASIAPYTAVVVAKSPAVAEALCNQLEEGGVDAVWEDRTPQLGYGLRAARETGWPLVITAGSRYEKDQTIDIQERMSGASTIVPAADIVSAVRALSAKL